MIKAVIFDKDGVLMFTEEAYYRAFRDSLKKFGNGKEFTWENHCEYVGVPTSETFFVLRGKYGVRVSYDEFVDDYRAGYNRIFEEEGLKRPDGVTELLDRLQAENIPFAIGTGGSRPGTEKSLLRTGLRDYFDVIITATEVVKGKPDPETFMKAAEQLGVDFKECVVIGDSINDVLAAKSAGMKMIAITDKSYSKDPALASPDIEVKKFNDITLEMIKSL